MRSPEYSPADRLELLEIARASIYGGIETGYPLAVSTADVSSTLRKERASFVTLTRGGVLRGCTGTLEAVRPLAVEVAEAAFRTAFGDPRFPPVVMGELDALEIEVSVLSPLEPIPVADEQALLDELVPGVDGLVIEAVGSQRATFLPKVWDHLPEPARFLAELKRKAGLSADGLPRDFIAYRYYTETFGGPSVRWLGRGASAR